MNATILNMPLYRVLRALNVADAEATAAAEVSAPDLTALATKDELRAEVAGVRTELARLATKDELRAEVAGMRTEIASVRAEVAQAAQRQTVWIGTIIVAATGILIAVQRLAPPPAVGDTPRPAPAAVRDVPPPASPPAPGGAPSQAAPAAPSR